MSYPIRSLQTAPSLSVVYRSLCIWRLPANSSDVRKCASIARDIVSKLPYRLNYAPYHRGEIYFPNLGPKNAWILGHGRRRTHQITPEYSPWYSFCFVGIRCDSSFIAGLEELSNLVTKWKQDPSTYSPTGMKTCLDSFKGVLFSHLDQEVTEIVIVKCKSFRLIHSNRCWIYGERIWKSIGNLKNWTIFPCEQ